jgi:hypothetical protein
MESFVSRRVVTSCHVLMLLSIKPPNLPTSVLYDLTQYGWIDDIHRVTTASYTLYIQTQPLQEKEKVCFFQSQILAWLDIVYTSQLTAFTFPSLSYTYK